MSVTTTTTTTTTTTISNASSSPSTPSLSRRKIPEFFRTDIRCQANCAQGGGKMIKCNREIAVALRVIVCDCGGSFCRKHLDRVAHNCTNKDSSTRSVAKGYFSGGKGGDGSNGVY